MSKDMSSIRSSNPVAANYEINSVADNVISQTNSARIFQRRFFRG